MGRLSYTKVRNAQPRPRPYRLYDQNGLYLEVRPTGRRVWRFRYKYGGRDRAVTLGEFPRMGLQDARDECERMRALLRQGMDPAAAGQRGGAGGDTGPTFRKVAAEWIAHRLSHRSEGYRSKVVRRLEREVYPAIGDRPIRDIRAAEVLRILRRIEARGTIETAHRVLGAIRQVMRYGVATGCLDSDPTRDLAGALAPSKTRHMAAPTDPRRVGELLRMVESYTGSEVVGAALRLLPLVFVRPGELRTMRWKEVDLGRREWRFTASKTGREHIVPLSRQAVAILEALRPLTQGYLRSEYVFPCARDPRRPMSSNAINAAYRCLGIDTREELTGHGWRATARTLLHEELGYPPEVIEHQLGHKPPDRLGRAYNRTRFLDQRHRMMQDWADYLDALRAGRLHAPARAAGAGAATTPTQPPPSRAHATPPVPAPSAPDTAGGDLAITWRITGKITGPASWP